MAFIKGILDQIIRFVGMLGDGSGITLDIVLQIFIEITYLH